MSIYFLIFDNLWLILITRILVYDGYKNTQCLKFSMESMVKLLSLVHMVYMVEDGRDLQGEGEEGRREHEKGRVVKSLVPVSGGFSKPLGKRIAGNLQLGDLKHILL